MKQFKAHLFYFSLVKKFFVSGHTKKPMFMPIIFLSLFFHPQEHTNPNILMDAKQWTLTLLLLRLSGLFVFYGLHTTKKIYLYYCNNNRDHAIILFIVVSQTNREYTSTAIGIPQLP